MEIKSSVWSIILRRIGDTYMIYSKLLTIIPYLTDDDIDGQIFWQHIPNGYSMV